MSAIRIIRQRLLTGAFLEVRNRATFLLPRIPNGTGNAFDLSKIREIFVHVFFLDSSLWIVDIESNFDRSAGVSQSSFSRNVTVIDGKATVASSSSRVDSIRPHGKPFSAAVALNTDDILEFYLSFSLPPLSSIFFSYFPMEIGNRNRCENLPSKLSSSYKPRRPPRPWQSSSSLRNIHRLSPSCISRLCKI